MKPSKTTLHQAAKLCGKVIGLGGVISIVEPDSIAEDLGWQPGDEIISINGHLLRDIIDFRYYSSDEFITVAVRRGDQTAEFEIEKDSDMPLGVSFEDILFDGVHTCGAHCIFCFVEQLPKGLRKSLYLKDDDYRLSFLHGNFITLANVSDEELQRIVQQRLTPLYVSVHTTDFTLRERMLGRRSPDILQQIDQLAQGHIGIETQIVLCRGVNDGSYLEKSVSDLAARYPTVESIAIVPAGISIHRKNPTPIGTIDPEYSRGIIRSVRKWQREYMSKYGTRLVWTADELYLNAGWPVPSARVYEGFPQIENGIGLVRQFLDSAVRTRKILPKHLPKPMRISVVTGHSALPVLTQWVDSIDCDNLDICVYPITNNLFGPTVTVTGLIPGKDVIGQLQNKDLGDALVIPSVSLRDGVFLDDVTVDDVARELRTRVIVVKPRPYQLVKAILRFISR